MQQHQTFDRLQRDVAAQLASVGIDDASAEAKALLLHVFGEDVWQWVADRRELGGYEVELRELDRLLDARSLRQPLSQVLGTKGFWTLDLKVTPDVLTPRADTESLVAAMLELTREQKTGRILDLGTGSGAILLAFLSERPGWTGMGVDISSNALNVARDNASANGLSDRTEFVCASWSEYEQGGYDLLVCNPPYIATDELDTLDPEVREHEPLLALDGGADGLNCYREIITLLPTWLKRNSAFGFEIGWQQAEAVRDLLQGTATDLTTHKDLGGRDRVICGRMR